MNTTLDKKTGEDLAPPPRPTLRLLYSGGEAVLPPVVFPLRRGATKVGREGSGDGAVQLDRDPHVSRHHATVHAGLFPGSLKVADGGSRNGTQLNGRPVTEAPLRDGDLLGIGDSYLLVRFEPRDLQDADVPELLGTSPAACSLRRALQLAGPTAATLLLLGESGSGKEVVARAAHRLSGRRGPFVAVNCGAIPESLAESQLFGHVAGAFTGASAQPGYFRAAQGGTLFLDEIGELPQSLQPKLLRALEERAVVPVGAVSPLPCDVRIIAATNRDLGAAVEQGRFRGDLYARLAELPLTLPPLRERREDVLALLYHFLAPLQPKLTPRLAEALLLHRWPFNVREVSKIASHLRIASAGATVLDLPLVAERLVSPARSAPAEAAEPEEPEERPDAERLTALLRTHRGAVSEVARALGRSRRQVYRWIAQYEIDVRALRAE